MCIMCILLKNLNRIHMMNKINTKFFVLIVFLYFIVDFRPNSS